MPGVVFADGIYTRRKISEESYIPDMRLLTVYILGVRYMECILGKRPLEIYTRGDTYRMCILGLRHVESVSITYETY